MKDAAGLAVFHHDRFHEELMMACEHGTSKLDSHTEGADALQAVMGQFVRAHGPRYGCRCAVAEVVHFWPSREAWEEAVQFDAQPHIRAQIAAVFGAEEEARMHAANERLLVQVAALPPCSHCEPGIKLPEGEAPEWLHTLGCPDSEFYLEYVDGNRRSRAWSKN